MRTQVRARAYLTRSGLKADELMVSSATREVLPVVELDGEPVGKGTPGPIYARLRQAYDDCLSALRCNEVLS